MSTLPAWISTPWSIGESSTPCAYRLDLRLTSSDVRSALLVLKDLIGQHKDLIEPTFYPSNRFELSFYRNQVIHLFVSEAMLCSAMYTRVKAGGTAPSQRMRRTDLLDELHFISRLLQHEFVYGTEGLEVNAAQTIASLEVRSSLAEALGSIFALTAPVPYSTIKSLPSKEISSVCLTLSEQPGVSCPAHKMTLDFL